MNNIDNLLQDWLAAKDAERLAIEMRRDIEDQLSKLFDNDERQEGTRRIDLIGYNVEINNKMTKKVDTDILKEIANQEELSQYMYTLFRWKAELNTKEWRQAGNNIKKVFSRAITTTPARPFYQITRKVH